MANKRWFWDFPYAIFSCIIKKTVLSMDCMSDFENRYTEQIVEILRVVPVAYDATGDKLIREIRYVVPEGE